MIYLLYQIHLYSDNPFLRGIYTSIEEAKNSKEIQQALEWETYEIEEYSLPSEIDYKNLKIVGQYSKGKWT